MNKSTNHKLYNCRLYVSADEVIDDAFIEIENGKINNYGSYRDLTTYCGYENLQGMTILPGLIDANTHITIPDNGMTYNQIKTLTDAQIGIFATRNALATLQGGITTIRDIGGMRHVDIQIRNYVNSKYIQGPTILAAGKAICVTGGHGYEISHIADGVEGIIQAVRAQCQAGSDVIKIIVSGGVLTEASDPNIQHMSDEEVKAAVYEAHRLGKTIAAHCQNLKSAKSAVNAGVDSIEHGIYLDDEVIESMLMHKTSLVPTLSAPAKIIEKQDASLPKYIYEKCLDIYEDHKRSFIKAEKAGVNILMGSDAGTPFNYHGDNRKEILFMCRNGMKFIDALRSATTNPAKYLSLHTSKGQLTIGFDADMLVVKGDPNDNHEIIGDADFIQSVYRKGECVKNRCIDEIHTNMRLENEVTQKYKSAFKQ